ncbi:MAG: GNAT family N-acetyltransferase [Anaerolineales bacterium]|nr:GNAT family N-acetyltransferase [Anaerolineales bacterium]
MPEILPVTKDNWRALTKLKVREDQRNFVATNTYSIAEAQFGDDVEGEGHWDMFPYGIYDGDTPVGFLMIAYNYNAPRFQGYILRLMVDEKFQGKGFGKFAMNWTLEKYRADDRVKMVAISYEPENEAARQLYASLGFVETGEIVDEEALAVLSL